MIVFFFSFWYKR